MRGVCAEVIATRRRFFFAAEAGECAFREGRCHDGFDEELGDLFRSGFVDFAIDADDSTEGGDRVGFEGARVSL